MNNQWLEKLMEQRGITMNALKNEFHFSPDTIYNWRKGTPARPHTLRKLAEILKVEYLTLVKGLAVKVLSTRDRKKRAPVKAEK